MEIITRAQWGARHADGFRDAPLPAREVWLHHSVTSPPGWDLADEKAALLRLERIGQERFNGGISYTFVIPPSGRVYQGHSVHRQGAHTGGRNDISRAICLIGNYENTTPTDEQVRAVADLVAHGHAAGWWTTPRLTGGHRDAPGASTACPGRHAYARITDINRRAATGGGAAPGGDDMPSAEEVADAVWKRMIYNHWLGRSEWAETVIGANQDRVIRQKLDPLIKAVADQGGVSPEDVADALAPRLSGELLPTIADVVERVLGTDNEDTARAIVDELSRTLASTVESEIDADP